MHPNEARRLQAFKPKLRTEVIFEHISTELLQAELINREEYQQIRSKHSDPERIDLLMEVLPQKGSDSYRKFLTILDSNYSWLAESLRNDAVVSTDDGNKTAKNENLNKVVTSDIIDVVRRNTRAVQRWTSLAHTLGLTKLVTNIRVRVCVYGEEHDMCLLYLLQEWVGITSKDATLNKLILALKEEGLNDVADELQIKFG